MNTKSPKPKFIVSLNSKKVLEFTRDHQLNDKQHKDLKKLDQKLNSGITIAGKFIRSPNVNDKNIFIASNLVTALDTGNDSIAAISCAYLATRHPDLKQLKISTTEDQISIQLIFDKEFTEQIPIKFVAKKDLI